ncbi:DUF2934 domain-containing protein [Candidatus Nitrospira bockiana]
MATTKRKPRTASVAKALDGTSPSQEERPSNEPLANGDGMAGNGHRHREHEIAQRAYELYEQRGHGDGHALEDWLQAEREILRQR